MGRAVDAETRYNDRKAQRARGSRGNSDKSLSMSKTDGSWRCAGMWRSRQGICRRDGGLDGVLVPLLEIRQSKQGVELRAEWLRTVG